MIGDELRQHRDEAVDRVGDLPGGVGHRRQRVVGAYIWLLPSIRKRRERPCREGAGYIIHPHDGGVGRRAGVRRFVAGTVLGALVLAVSACGSGGLFGREYEYEEEIYLKVDGSATVVVNASLAALSALRGAPSFDDGDAGVDRDAVRRFFQSPVTEVARVSRPWERHGRKFVQVRVATADIRSLSKSVPFAWSA